MSTFRQLTIRGGIRGAPRRKLGALALGLGLLAASARGQGSSPPYHFTTLAGTASIGSADGAGSAARFDRPSDLAVDSAGNLYVTDTDNDTIRTITPDGVVTTIAGLAGVAGSADGTGSAARFDGPMGMARDIYGNLYVADCDNGTIRRVTPSGLVTTIAGLAGSAGNEDGEGSAARFDRPMGVAVDSLGNVYVADAGNYAVRKIAPGGTVTTVTAGAIAVATFRTTYLLYPRFVAVDPSRSLYVVYGYDGYDYEAGAAPSLVFKIAPDGTTTPVMPPAGGYPFAAITGLAIDAAGNLWFADAYARHLGIVEFTPAGATATMLRETSQDWLYVGQPIYPNGIAIDALGTLYVADSDASAVQKMTPTGVSSTLAGLGRVTAGSADGSGPAAQFFNPQGVAADAAGNAYVADDFNETIRKIGPDGVVTTLAGLAGVGGHVDGTGSAARLAGPMGVAADRDGNVYFSETSTIRKITPDGAVTTLAGHVGTTGGLDGTGSWAFFNEPTGVAVDGAGNVFVADTGNATIRKITPDGVVTTLAGLERTWGNTDGAGSAARFNRPWGIAVDRFGNLYVADQTANTIRKIAPDGMTTTLAGLANFTGSSDGVGSAATFNHPMGVAVDPAGNVYVADFDNLTVRRVTPDGRVTTVAGLTGSLGSADGTGSECRFNYPTGIAVDSSGRLYVSDSWNQTIRLGIAASAPVILNQPQSQTVVPGGTAQFSVTVSGAPEPTLQWFRNGVAIPGATTGTLSLSGVLASDAGDYTVTATNALGSATSSKATLTVNAQPSVSVATGSAGPGGGGAIEAWFTVALLVLSAGRRTVGGGFLRAGRRIREPGA